MTGSYTWSHSLDEGSGLGLFYNGNNPLVPRSGYASSDFDRTQVLAISYLYEFPNLIRKNSLLKKVLNNWSISGITVLESGQPYNVYDFSGAVGSIYYSANDFITNPVVPLAPGFTSQSVQLQGAHGVNPGQPVLNVNGFAIPLLQPGQSGVPPCETVNGQQVCDNGETGFGSTGRNIFRGPFQSRWDLAISKRVAISERINLKYSFSIFNVFNTPSFDAPNNNVTFNPCFNPTPCYTSTPTGQLGQIQHSIGSPRLIQMSLHLNF